VRYFNEALEASPANAGAYLGLYAALLELSEFNTVLARAAEHEEHLPGDPWALLARGAALQRLRRESEAGAACEQAFALMDSAARSRLTRLSRILPRSDSLRYEHVSRARQALTNEQFWRDADSLRLTAANEIQTEFYSRLVEAELRYSDHRFGRSGAASDRGTMWIRYGPPTIRASFPTEMVRSADLTDGAPSRSSALQGMLLELWYWEEYNLHVVFQGAPG
jgi:GWxTD domain-containing protein